MQAKSQLIKLSVCIPTHNFGGFIGDALTSVIRQAASAPVEIVVLDSASTDNTKDVVLGHSRSPLPIRYHYQAYKGGIDADMARVVELANGEYCWLLSADDALVDGAIGRILTELQNPHRIYLCNRVWCDTRLAPLDFEPWLPRQFTDASFDFADGAMLKQYFGKAQSIGALFSYMSSIVVNRCAWMNVPDGLRLKGTNYAHVYRLFSMARAPTARVRYLSDPLILCRSGNDSFMTDGIVARYLLDMRGYDELARHLFSENDEMQDDFRAVVCRQHRWFLWAWLISTAKENERSAIAKYLAAYGYPNWLNALTVWVGESPAAVYIAGRVDALVQRIRMITRRKLGFLSGRPGRLAPSSIIRSVGGPRARTVQ